MNATGYLSLLAVPAYFFGIAYADANQELIPDFVKSAILDASAAEQPNALQQQIIASTGKVYTVEKPSKDCGPEVLEFFKQFGLRKDLLICEKHTQGFCCTIGSNISQGQGGIVMAPGFKEADVNAYYFVFKHEVKHLLTQDSMRNGIISGIASLAAAIFGIYSKMTFYPALLTTCAVGTSVSTILSLSHEGAADDFGIANSSNEELKSGRAYFKAMKQVNIEAGFPYSSTGEHVLFVTHPTITSRIKKVDVELEKRGLSIDESVEKEKMARIADCLRASQKAAYKDLETIKNFFLQMIGWAK